MQHIENQDVEKENEDFRISDQPKSALDEPKATGLQPVIVYLSEE